MIKKLLILVILLLGSIPAFSQTVDTAWVRIYNGSANSDDCANDIAVDDSGYVYVTGYSYSTGPNKDYATIKYYSNGDTAWVRLYNRASDEAFAIAVSKSGNVYVTGSSFDQGAQEDVWITICYDKNGDTLWTRKYGTGLWNFARDLLVDKNENLYVTGETLDDLVTIKYSSNGDTAWVRRYSGANSPPYYGTPIALDDSGYVYIIGTTVNGCVIIKYTGLGDTVWTVADSSCDCEGIGVDDSGYVYVVGDSCTILTGCDYCSRKYKANGDLVWVRTYNYDIANNDENAYDLAVDKFYNVFVTGRSYNENGYRDYATVKYYPNGDVAWVRRYNGPANDQDKAYAIAVDSSGNAYVTGYSVGFGSDYDYVTIGYKPDGGTLWVDRYNGQGNGSDWANSILVDKFCNVYVTGESYSGIDWDYTTIKYLKFTDVKDETGSREKPSEFTLSQNYPNPFNQSTKIEFTLSQSGFVNLTIYDLLGRRIKTLVSENLNSGYKSMFWDSKDDSGKEVSSGIYFYRLKIGDYSEAKRLVLLK